MFKIRQEQFDGFSEVTRNNFLQRLTADLQESNPECFVLQGDDVVEQIIAESIDKAFQYGIQLESNVAQFVRVQLEEGQHFEDRSDCRHIKQHLSDDSIEESVKIQQLWIMVEQRITPAPATSAEQDSDQAGLDPQDGDIDLREQSPDHGDTHDFDTEDEFDFEDVPDEWDQ